MGLPLLYIPFSAVIFYFKIPFYFPLLSVCSIVKWFDSDPLDLTYLTLTTGQGDDGYWDFNTFEGITLHV